MAEQELAAAGAVQRPAQHGGVSEQRQAHGDDDGAALLGENGTQGLGVQGGGALVADVQVQSAALPGAQHGQTGQGADDDGIDEHFKDAVETLLHAVGLGGRGVGHRRRT